MGNCDSTFRKACLSETDIRYDNDYPKDIVGQDKRWEKFSGYFKVELYSFNATDGSLPEPRPYFPGGRGGNDNSPYVRNTGTAWYNHTIDGSRMYIHRHYLSEKAPESFCNEPLLPGYMNHALGGVCGKNGIARVAGLFLAVNHDNEGTLEQVSSYGNYAFPGTFVPSTTKISDENTFETVANAPGVWSSSQSYVFFDNDNAIVSAVHTSVLGKKIQNVITGTMVRASEEEYITGLNEDYDKFNITEADRTQVPLTSNEAIPGSFPKETSWCGGIINDAACTESPYQEPNPVFTGWAIALFVVIGVFIFGFNAFFLHRKIMQRQKRHIQLRMIRGIAQNITIADSAGKLDSASLLKEFEFIDSNKGGTISKDEMKKWLEDGKLGFVSKKDFDSLWVAMDTDGSGEVDFVEFTTFLSGCGAAFNEVFEERKQMTKGEKMKRASRRLSTMDVNFNEAVKEANDMVKMDGSEEA